MKIIVYQDTVCPWCFIGKRFLKEAIDQFEGEVELKYKSYLLNPNAPKAGEDATRHLEKKYGKQKTEEMRDKLRTIGKEANINFNFNVSVKLPNSMLSHQLIKIFPNHTDDILESIYKAYFIDRKFIGDINILTELVDDIVPDLDKSSLKTKLLQDDGKEDVLQDYRRAQKIGVQGVPFFVFNNEQALTGAHKPEIILQTMNRIRARENIQIDLMQD